LNSATETDVFPNSVKETSLASVYINKNTNIPVTAILKILTNNYNEIRKLHVKDATAFKVRELAFKL
jgi:hypothetical protein